MQTYGIMHGIKEKIKEVLPCAIAFGETIGGAAEHYEIGKDKFLELLNKD